MLKAGLSGPARPYRSVLQFPDRSVGRSCSEGRSIDDSTGRWIVVNLELLLNDVKAADCFEAKTIISSQLDRNLRLVTLKNKQIRSLDIPISRWIGSCRLWKTSERRNSLSLEGILVYQYWFPPPRRPFPGRCRKLYHHTMVWMAGCKNINFQA